MPMRLKLSADKVYGCGCGWEKVRLEDAVMSPNRQPATRGSRQEVGDSTGPVRPGLTTWYHRTYKPDSVVAMAVAGFDDGGGGYWLGFRLGLLVFNGWQVFESGLPAWRGSSRAAIRRPLGQREGVYWHDCKAIEHKVQTSVW